MKMLFSRFSKHFSPIVLSSNTVSIKNSQFSHILNNAITISSKSEEKKKVFSKRQTINSGNSATFESCLFNRISSQGEGGAVYISTSDCDAKFIQCGFVQCSSKDNGGALYISSHKVIFESTCFTRCTTNGKSGGSLYITKTSNCGIKDTLFENSKGETIISLSNAGSLDLQCINLTANTPDDSSLEISDPDSDIYFQKNVLFKNEGNYIISITGLSQDFSHSNFISNSVDRAIIKAKGSYRFTIIESYIINEKSRYLGEDKDNNITFRDCYFSFTSDEAKSKANGCCSIIRGTFDVTDYSKINIATDDCYITGSSGGISTGAIIAIVIVLMVGLAVIIFIARKRCCIKFADNDPLIKRYTP